tara:strand:- start:136 stop:642 length:507 start_codon:yes stop_codon:yes gene_type:complete
MNFSIGDKILFKKDTLKGKISKINSAYKVTVLTEHGFEMNVSVKDIVKVNSGTDKASSYGKEFYSKDFLRQEIKSKKQQKSQGFIKIDLHIELLTPNYHYMDNFEIVQLQLNKCHEKIEKAINSNVNRIEIVHGIGEGVLKNEVHKILRDYNLRFYLKKDGGSTEVFL